MHITLFGGAFDPPHLGHATVASSLIEYRLCDQVWFVPVYIHPWAKKLGKTQLTPYLQRLKMVRLLTTPPAILVQEYRSVSYTYNTLRYFEKKHPEHHFSWVMGSEYLPKFDAFLEQHPQLSNYTIFIYPRHGYPLAPLYPFSQVITQVPEIAISSTQVREKIKKGEPVNQLLHPAVNQYLEKHRLYQETI